MKGFSFQTGKAAAVSPRTPGNFRDLLRRNCGLDKHCKPWTRYLGRYHLCTFYRVRVWFLHTPPPKKKPYALNTPLLRAEKKVAAAHQLTRLLATSCRKWLHDSFLFLFLIASCFSFSPRTDTVMNYYYHVSYPYLWTFESCLIIFLIFLIFFAESTKNRALLPTTERALLEFTVKAGCIGAKPPPSGRSLGW